MLDVTHKVVGVGSVGTRDYIVLLQGNHKGDHLFLQVKEALPSVVRDPRLATHVHHGQHVVDGQRRIQSVSDPFIGWTDVGTRPYYVRQLRDMKGVCTPISCGDERWSTTRSCAARSSPRRTRGRVTRP